MSDQPSILSDEPLDLDDLSDNQFNQILAANGLLVPCPSCRSRDWRLDPTKRAKNLPAHIPVQKLLLETVKERAPDAPPLEDLNLPIVMVVCGVCGFIRQHDKGTFVAFLDALHARMRERFLARQQGSSDE